MALIAENARPATEKAKARLFFPEYRRQNSKGIRTVQEFAWTPGKDYPGKAIPNAGWGAHRRNSYTKHQDFSFIDHLAEDLIAAKEHILSYSD